MAYEKTIDRMDESLFLKDAVESMAGRKAALRG
jgi:hypothetical protein